jgi:hypothetical protein
VGDGKLGSRAENRKTWFQAIFAVGRAGLTPDIIQAFSHLGHHDHSAWQSRRYFSMSRSIHSTRQTLHEIRQIAFSSDEEKAAAIKKVRFQLWRKRQIKSSVLAERHPAEVAGMRMTASEIPVRVIDTHEHLYHAASEPDIRNVLTRLPPEATEGISLVRLELGLEYMKGKKQAHDDVDLWFGRPSGKIFGEVYAGKILGTYYPESGSISLYGYACDPEKLPLPKLLCELYLRLKVLATLVHEVAHHHDHQCRVNRGRWLADRTENVKNYAEIMEHRWTQEVVVPYLEEAYPRDVRGLLAWVARKGGLRLPLTFFIGDPRTTLRNGRVRYFFPTDSAFESWVDDLEEHPTLLGSRLAFAWELHYCDHYEECLQIVDHCLKSAPEHVPALICRGDTLVHLERFDEALEMATCVLRLDTAHARALEICGDVLVAKANWKALLRNCDDWDRVATTVDSRKVIQMHRATAHCALGDEASMEASIQDYLDLLPPLSPEIVRRREMWLRRSVLRRAGRHEK